MPRSSLALCGLAVYGIALWEYSGSVTSGDAWWIRMQEQKARHIVSSLEHMRNTVKPYDFACHRHRRAIQPFQYHFLLHPRLYGTQPLLDRNRPC